jgi:hypothetical protein
VVEPVGGVPELFVELVEKLLFFGRGGLRHGAWNSCCGEIVANPPCRKIQAQAGIGSRLLMKQVLTDSLFPTQVDEMTTRASAANDSFLPTDAGERSQIHRAKQGRLECERIFV